MSFLIRGKINKKISRAVDLFDEKIKITAVCYVA